MTTIMEAGAMGCEIAVAGKLRSDRAHKEKYRMGVVPKSGETADQTVRSATTDVLLKLGLFGIKVKIAIPDALPPPIEFAEARTEKASGAAPAAQVVPQSAAPQAMVAQAAVAATAPVMVEAPPPTVAASAPALPAEEPGAAPAKKTRAKRTKGATGTRKKSSKKAGAEAKEGE